MHTGRLIYALLAGGIVLLALVFGAVWLGFAPGPTVDPSRHADQPAVVSATTNGATCIEESEPLVSTDVHHENELTYLTVSATVTVPATNYALESPTLESTGDRSYVLNVTSFEDDEKSPENCEGLAQANYTADLRLPHADGDSFDLAVYHDGEVVEERQFEERS